MVTYTDGTRFSGLLEKGQIWVKGKTERTIVDFDKTYMYFKTKQGKTKSILRSSFRDWAHSGAMVKVDDNKNQ